MVWDPTQRKQWFQSLNKSQTNMGGSNWPPWLPEAKAVQLNSVCLNPTGQHSNAWALFLGYYLGCLSFLFFLKSTFPQVSLPQVGEAMFLMLSYFKSQTQRLINMTFNSLRQGGRGGGGIHSGILRFKKSYNIVLGTQRTTYLLLATIINNNSSVQVTVTSDKSRKQVIFSSCDYSTLRDTLGLLINKCPGTLSFPFNSFNFNSLSKKKSQ